MWNVDVDKLKIIVCSLNKKVNFFVKILRKLMFFVMLGESCFCVKFMWLM
jgi:hypothetical protein